jgi:hypothetical protein
VSASSSPAIQAASIVGFRVFDLCVRIDLATAGKELEKGGPDRPTAMSFRAPQRIASIFRRSALPLRVELGARTLELSHGVARTAQLSVDLYDHGAVAVLYEIAISAGTSLDDVRRLAHSLSDSEGITALALKEAESLCEKMPRAAQDVHAWRKSQSYAVVFVQEAPGSEALLAWAGLPRLLSGEAREGAPSTATTDDLRRYSDSYYADDLVVIGSRVALVVEPSGNREMIDLLEFALSQLLQLRYYDESLDTELHTLRSNFAARSRGIGAIFRSYGLLVRDVARRLVEVTEFTERIENALKVIGGDYAARVYGKAIDRFGVLLLKDAVGQKQKLVAEIWEILSDEADGTRSLALEVTIVALIVVEIVLAFAVPGH